MILGYFTGTYGRSSDTFVRNEVRELRGLGHVVHTFSARRPGREEVVSEDVRAEQDRTTYLVERGLAAMLASTAALAVRAPRRMARAATLAWRTRPAGLRALAFQVGYLLEASLLARELLARRVEHLHDHVPESSATVAMLAAALSGISFSMTVHGPGIFFRPGHWALGTKIQHSAFTVCISEFCRSQCMIFAEPADWPRLHVVHCAVESRFLEGDVAPVPDVRRLVCVGRLCAEKGQLLLVAAIAELNRRGTAVELSIVGDGPLRPLLEQRIAEHGLQSAVRLEGRLSSDDVRRLILSSRAVVLPSFAEGLPVVLMEALALRRPVISTYVGAIPELVVPGIHGRLVSPGALDELVAALQWVIAAPVDELRSIGEAGARRVAERHHPRVEAKKLACLFEATRDASLLRVEVPNVALAKATVPER